MNAIDELKEKIKNNKKEMMGTGRLYDFEMGLTFGRLLRNAELIKAVSERRRELIDYYGKSAQVAPRLNELKWFLEILEGKHG